jgi:DnaJ-domain-containing protein 1
VGVTQTYRSRLVTQQPKVDTGAKSKYQCRLSVNYLLTAMRQSYSNRTATLRPLRPGTSAAFGTRAAIRKREAWAGDVLDRRLAAPWLRVKVHEAALFGRHANLHRQTELL